MPSGQSPHLRTKRVGRRQLLVLPFPCVSRYRGPYFKADPALLIDTGRLTAREGQDRRLNGVLRKLNKRVLTGLDHASSQLDVGWKIQLIHAWSILSATRVWGGIKGDCGRKWISQVRRDWCQASDQMTKPDSSGTHSRAASRLDTRDPA